MTDNGLPNNRIRNGFLDDLDNADSFLKEKLETAQELLYQIFDVTNGAGAIPADRNWAQKNLLELLKMFMIRHKNFSRSDFVEELQHQIYHYTSNYDKSYRKWREKVFAEKGLDGDGEQLANEEITEVK